MFWVIKSLKFWVLGYKILEILCFGLSPKDSLLVTKFWEPIYRSNNSAKKTFQRVKFFCPAPRAPKVYSIDSSWKDSNAIFFILKIMLCNLKIFSKKVKNRGIFGTKKILLQKCVNFQIQSLAAKK